MRTPALLVLAPVVVLLLAGCTDSTATDAAPRSVSATNSGGAEPTGTLTVFAAASLTDAFTELGERLEDQHPGLAVQFNFAGSSALAAQLEQGAPADVFASADEAQVARAEEAGLVEASEIFALNRLMLAAPPDNPLRIVLPEGGGNPSLTELLPDDLTP